MKAIVEAWRDLNRNIYVGRRLKSNLLALTAVSIFCALLGIGLIVRNIVNGRYGMIVASAATLLGGVLCAYLAGVRKNRRLAAAVPTVFCFVAFTVYVVTGAAEGTALLWCLLLPTGVCYFASVRSGMLLSAYYSVLFFVLFYTPLKENFARFYSEAFMSRFPLIFVSLAIFTAIAMIQYHRNALVEIQYSDRLNKEVNKQTKVAIERADKLEQMSEEMVLTLAVTIDAKDKYTNGHSFRVSLYAVELAKKLGWSGEEVAALRREALLHDIGKIGVPDAVLNKPGRLTDEEFVVIKSHTTIGSEILARSGNLTDAAMVARHHHERYDGRGYPDGLSGGQIPLHARVVAVADAYDAMRSDRIYRKGLPLDVIRGELLRGRGTQFDPQLLDAFLKLFDEGALEEIAHRELESVGAA